MKLIQIAVDRQPWRSSTLYSQDSEVEQQVDDGEGSLFELPYQFLGMRCTFSDEVLFFSSRCCNVAVEPMTDLAFSPCFECCRRHENTPYLPGVALSKLIIATTRVEEATEGADIVFIVVPTPFVRGR